MICFKPLPAKGLISVVFYNKKPLKSTPINLPKTMAMNVMNYQTLWLSYPLLTDDDYDDNDDDDDFMI